MPVRAFGVVAVAAIAGSFGAVAGSASGTQVRTLRPRSVSEPSRFALANHCWTMSSTRSRGFLQPLRVRYRQGRSRANAARFYLKPTRLGSYLIYDQDRLLMRAASRTSVDRLHVLGKRAVWTVKPARGRGFRVVSVGNGRKLAVMGDSRLTLAGKRRTGRGARFTFSRAHGCRRYPEARTGAKGRPFTGIRPNGTVKGFVDAHLHITADMRAGGQVIFGRSFSPKGVTRALSTAGDARVHGPDGSEDVTGNLLRSGTPFGTHDTHGWPTFAGWPVHDTITHQQTYYVWLKRAWMAGERLVVAQTVEDEPLCRLEPRRSHSCDETRAIKLEIDRLKRLERYVDAQAGGPGKGWFRIVRNPRQARRVIARGKLAVVIGIESSDLFGCSELEGEPQCTKEDVNRGIRDYKRLGVRSMFIAHWVDNAFAGAALEGGAKGSFINVLEALQTGHYFDTAPCPEKGQGEEVTPLSTGVLSFLQQFFPNAGDILGIPIPDYPAGKQCNAKGLTKLGHYLVRRLMANHILIEADHMSERARLVVLKMAEKRNYPLVSSHTDTGGHWTPSDLRRLYALHGFSTATLADPASLPGRILRFRPYRKLVRHFGVGLGTDTGGFNELPGPPAGDPLTYPFRLGGVRFIRERTGKRIFDLNTDGVAQYGLVPDLIADMRSQPDGREATRTLFHSAQAYLDTWQAALRHR
jgi:microsomal dipeptidase-like Zn-dependent dipeptidase